MMTNRCMRRETTVRLPSRRERHQWHGEGDSRQRPRPECRAEAPSSGHRETTSAPRRPRCWSRCSEAPSTTRDRRRCRSLPAVLPRSRGSAVPDESVEYRPQALRGATAIAVVTIKPGAMYATYETPPNTSRRAGSAVDQRADTNSEAQEVQQRLHEGRQQVADPEAPKDVACQNTTRIGPGVAIAIVSPPTFDP